jgi:ribosomal protein S27AE
MTSGTLIAPPDRLVAAVSPDARRTYTCPECGQVLHVSGLGRHRVYFELTDTGADDPVMNRVCPACGHGLAGKNPR